MQQQVRHEVGECDADLTVLAASAHWASRHAPNGSLLWDEGCDAAAANASHERDEVSGLALDWQPFFEPEAGGVGAAGPDSALARAGLRTYELCLDQEKTIVFSMPPAPALVRWLVAQPVADAAATNDDACDDDGASDVAEDDPDENSSGWTEKEASDWIEHLQTHGSLPLEAIAVGFRATPFAELKRWVEEREGATSQRSSARQRRSSALGGARGTPSHVQCLYRGTSLWRRRPRVALGLTQETWDAQLLPANEPVAVSAEGRAFVEQLLARAEGQENRVQDPVPNREEEPNNRNNDWQMRAWSEVRTSSDGELKWLSRERAWSWYHVQEVI